MLNGRSRRVLVFCGISTLIIGCSPTTPAPQERTAPSAPAGQAVRGAAGVGHEYYPADGNGGYNVLDYHVAISYDPARQGIDAETTVTAKAKKTLSSFNLDLRGLRVKSVSVNGKKARFSREGEFELVITPAEHLPSGSTFRTTVVYSGVPEAGSSESLGSNGWHRTETGATFVLGEPHSASYWYPVNGTPRDKATFHLDARVPKGWSAVSIGRLTGKTTKGGWTTWHWAEPNRVAPYLTTLAVNKFTIERGKLPDGTPVLNAYAPGAESTKTMGKRVGEVIKFLEGKFGPYPQSAAGGIYLGTYVGFSLETQGRPSYTLGIEMPVVVHELAHQWYGNSVTVRSWADICLNECLASYAMWLWAAEKQGVNLDARYRRYVDQVRDSEAFWENKLYDMGAGNEFTGVYNKGALAIHALRQRIGEQAFAKVLREWPARHKDGNASWPEFERFVAEVSGQNLRPFFDAWFHATTIPAPKHLYPGTLGN